MQVFGRSPDCQGACSNGKTCYAMDSRIPDKGISLLLRWVIENLLGLEINLQEDSNTSRFMMSFFLPRKNLKCLVYHNFY